MQLDSPDSYCAMNKYFYELYEHEAIDELTFRELLDYVPGLALKHFAKRI